MGAIRDGQGEWTTSRVQKLYRSRAYAVPMRKTARDDLAQLHRQGFLTLDGRDPNRRFYTLNSTMEGTT